MKYLKVFLFLGVFLPVLASAAPVITNFSVNPVSMNSDIPATFVWSIQDASGYSFSVPCIAGVKYSDASIGTQFACGTPKISTDAVNDYIALKISNFSGSMQSIQARLVPKDLNGVNADSAALTATVSVNALPNPILSFEASPTTIFPGYKTTLSWTTQDIDGVNLKIICSDNVKISSPSYTSSAYLPCNTPVFPADRVPTGSLDLNFQNSSYNSADIKLELLPAIQPQMYDGTKSSSVIVSVLGATTTQTASVSSYVVPASVVSGQSFGVSWQGANTASVNFKFSCNAYVSAISSVNPNSTIPCDALAFFPALSGSGSFQLNLINKSQSAQNMMLTILPSSDGAAYDTAYAKTVSILVLPVQQQQNTSVSMPSSPPSAVQSSNSGTNSVIKYIFSKTLKRGMSGADVTALQQFLARDPALYPEGTVTGYFGALTEKAVQRFQAKNGVVSSGTPFTTGYGQVGAKTRAKLNSL